MSESFRLTTIGRTFFDNLWLLFPKIKRLGFLLERPFSIVVSDIHFPYSFLISFLCFLFQILETQLAVLHLGTQF